MFCRKCGKKLSDGSQFCPFCGTKLKSVPQEYSNTENITKAAIVPDLPEVPPKKKTSKKIWITIAAIISGLAVAAVILITLYMYQPTIPLKDYVKVKYSGYDTAGTAEVVFDEKKFEEDYGEKLINRKSRYLSINKEHISKEDYDKANALTAKTIGKDFFAYYVSEKFNKADHLKNGDKISCSLSGKDNLISNIFNCKIENGSTDYTVSGLKEVSELDPFEGLEVSFEGTAPYGILKVTKTISDDIHADLRFDASKVKNLKNGDTVTISVTPDHYFSAENRESGMTNDENAMDAETYFLSTYGVKLTSMSKDYTVDNLEKYIESASEISQDTINNVNNTAKKTFESYNIKSEFVKTKKFSYIGTYIGQPGLEEASAEPDTRSSNTILDYNMNSFEYDLSADQSVGNSSPLNRVYFVYKATVSEKYTVKKKKFKKEKDLYWFISFEDAKLKSDGTNNIGEIQPGYSANDVTVDTKITPKGKHSSFKFKYKANESIDEFVSQNVWSNSDEDNIQR